MIAEFKRLGSKIVHADFSRVIVSTRKRSVSDAMAYIDYVANSIASKELFHSIALSVVNVSNAAVDVCVVVDCYCLSCITSLLIAALGASSVD